MLRTPRKRFLGGKAGVINCDLGMSKPFDIELERLTGPATDSGMFRGAAAGQRGTFFLETFGCQMNDHDSEKVAGVLLSRGYQQVETPEAASLILYNTCSIREKAAQKVFSRLGEYREKQSEGKVIGVLGCVAQQEGEEIFKRAPWVSLVCGSASYSKLPEMIAQLEAGNQRVTGLDTDTDETFETDVTRRDNPWRAYLTIIEGCDKACSYCVVPFTRGPERSRASDSILREVRQLAELGYSEVQLLGQTVNSYADPLRNCCWRWPRRTESAACGSLPRTPATSRQTLWKRSSGSQRSATTCTCRCSRVRRECCAQCSGPIRAKSIWKRSP